MKRNVLVFALFAVLVVMASCKDEGYRDFDRQARQVDVAKLSEDMQKVRDYVPPFAVMAHRGSTYWAPEETEIAYRWARNMGADYLEADLQCTKDGVILANHDDNLRRTSNIELLYGETIPASRLAFYKAHGLSEDEAKKQLEEDRKTFEPYYTKSYFYDELAKLDAGAWFVETKAPLVEITGATFSLQNISTLEDLIKIAQGKKLKRNASHEREYTISGTWDPTKPMDCLTYHFEYEDDDKDTGHRPGIYIEFKESWLNPSDFEERVYNELKRLDWNIIEKPSAEGEPFYKGGKVNVGNTNGRVILQTFSLESLRRAADKFQGKIPMCFLLWKGTGATDIKKVTPEGYASFVNLGVAHKAHIMGPSIAGAPNNYDDLDEPWMALIIKRAGMLNHPYSFDSYDQMAKYFGKYNFGYKTEDDDILHGVCADGVFTNRTEISLQYMIDNGFRAKEAAQTVPDPIEVLKDLGN